MAIGFKAGHNPEIFASDFFGIVINGECDSLGIVKNVSHQVSDLIGQVFFLLALPANLRCINTFHPNRDIMAEEFIGPVIIEGGAWKVYAASIGVVARYDCDIRDGGSVSHGQERKQNGEGE